MLDHLFRSPPPEPAALAHALHALPAFADVDVAELTSLPQKGLTHAHWRIGARRTIARIPLAANGDPATALAAQAASFRRAASSGHTPRLQATLAPSLGLPFGVLVIDEIIGRPPKLPAELALLAAALAAIHSVPMPAPSERPPLPDPADAFAATLTACEGDVPLLAGARLAGGALPQIEEELGWARQYIATNTAGQARMERTLVVTDAHPGNFLISGDRHAVFLDLEKMLYGAPAIDLAHATSLPALLWDADVAVRLSRDDIRDFCRAYFVHRGGWAKDEMLPWLLPARRLTWLRTTLAFARFRAQDAIARLAPRAASQASRAIDTALDPLTIAEIRRDWLGPEPFTF